MKSTENEFENEIKRLERLYQEPVRSNSNDEDLDDFDDGYEHYSRASAGSRINHEREESLSRKRRQSYSRRRQVEISARYERERNYYRPQISKEPKQNTAKSSLLMALLASSIFLAGAIVANGLQQLNSMQSNEFSEPNNSLKLFPSALRRDSRLPQTAEIIHQRMQEGSINAPKSTITGIVDSESMTASLYWTLALKNNNNTDKEAAITIDLPKNSAVSRATLWVNGVAQEAAFSANEKVQQAYDQIVIKHRDPLLVTQIAPNRIRILAAPVTANGGEMKLRIGLTTPVELNENGEHRLQMPKIVESNLKFEGKQDIHLTSDTPISGVGKTDESGIYVLRANINVGDLANTQISLTKPSITRFATRLTHTNPTEYVMASVKDGKLELTRMKTKPECKIISDDDAAFRLSNLWAHHEIERLAAHGQVAQACDLANIYRIVSSVSGATVLEFDYDYSNNSLNRNMYRVIGGRSADNGDAFDSTTSFTGSQAQQGGATAAPTLNGATNGTIGPQGGDAVVINSVNTAGTVRVNNLANLEAGLYTIANFMQLFGVLLGAFIGIEALRNNGLAKPISLSKAKAVLLASIIAAGGIFAPSVMCSLIAFLRDLNFIS